MEFHPRQTDARTCHNSVVSVSSVQWNYEQIEFNMFSHLPELTSGLHVNAWYKHYLSNECVFEILGSDNMALVRFILDVTGL